MSTRSYFPQTKKAANKKVKKKTFDENLNDIKRF